MDDIDELVKIYESRKHEVEILANSVLTFFQKEPTLKFGQNDSVIHSLKCRIKETSHLRDKLKRKASESDPITKDNFFDRITDLAGVRVLHLYNDQFSIIHQAIMKYVNSGNWVLKEPPVANTWDPEYKKCFEENGLQTEIRESLYTSVHYVIKPNKNPDSFCCEIQIRTLFEEIWGEIAHTIDYPHPTESLACREQLKVLAKLASTGTRLADSIFRSLQEHNRRKSDSLISSQIKGTVE